MAQMRSGKEHCNQVACDVCSVIAGFTSKQAYKMAIPAIGIVAVLVANVTFVAWTTPPGLQLLPGACCATAFKACCCQHLHAYLSLYQ